MNTRPYWLIFPVLTVLLPLSGVELVNEKGISGELILPSSPSAAEKYAVEELAHFVQKMTGRKLEIRTAKSGKKAAVEWIKTSSGKMKNLSAKVQKEAKKLKDDAFLIDADPSGVRIIGRHDRALLYGTYRLLKDEGVVFLMPGKENEVIPAKKSFSVKNAVRTFSPVFSYRRVILNGGSGYTPATYDWITRNGLQFSIGGSKPRKEYAKWAPVYGGGGHDMTNLMLGDRKGVDYRKFVTDLMKKHPEYFGLYEGKRIFGGNPSRANRGPFCQVCTSNKEVLARMVNTAQGIINNFKGNDYARTFSGDDHFNWCSCSLCKKADGRIPEDRNGRMSNRYWLFVNHMAEKLLNGGKNPDLKLFAMVYQNYRSVPQGVKPDHRVSPIICPHQRCYVHSLTDPKCPSNIQRFKEGMFEPWAKTLCRSVTFEYHTNLPGNSYLPVEKPWIDDLKYYHKLNMAGFGLVTRAPDGNRYIPRRKYLGENMWRSLWQLHYLTACFAWDINSNYEEIYEKINLLYYGKAWKEMKKYRKALRKYLLASDLHMYYGSPYSLTGNVLDQPGALITLEKYLAGAEKLVKDSPLHLKRVQKEKGYFERDWKRHFQSLMKRKESDIAVGRSASKVVIDAKEEDPIWKKSTPIHNFVLNTREKNLPTLAASVKVGYDEDHLYFFLKAEKNKKGSLRLKGGEGSKKIFVDSHFEIIVSPGNMKGKDYQIALNAAGKKIQMLGNGEMDRKIADIKPVCAIKDHGKYWCAEVKIPVKTLAGKIQPGDVWKLNVIHVGLADNGKMEFASICDGLFHGVPLFRNAVMGSSIKLLENTDFELLQKPEQPKQKGRKNTWKFPEDQSFASWRFSNANPGTLLIGKKDPFSGRHFMRILAKGKYAFIEQRIKLPPRDRNTENYSFKVMARGNANLLIRLRGPKARYYGNVAAKINSGEWETVAGSIRCGEKGYLVLTIRVNGDIDLDSLRLVMTDAMKEEMPDSSKH